MGNACKEASRYWFNNFAGIFILYSEEVVSRSKVWWEIIRKIQVLSEKRCACDHVGACCRKLAWQLLVSRKNSCNYKCYKTLSQWMWVWLYKLNFKKNNLMWLFFCICQFSGLVFFICSKPLCATEWWGNEAGETELRFVKWANI